MDHVHAFSMQTLHGNPVCASAAHAVLSTAMRELLAENADRVGRILSGEILRAALGLACIGEVRGRGLALGVELVKEGTNEPDTDLARKTVFRAWELGVVLYWVGTHAKVLELTPPLVTTDSQARFAAETIVRAIRNVRTGLVSDRDVSQFSGW